MSKKPEWLEQIKEKTDKKKKVFTVVLILSIILGIVAGFYNYVNDATEPPTVFFGYNINFIIVGITSTFISYIFLIIISSSIFNVELEDFEIISSSLFLLSDYLLKKNKLPEVESNIDMAINSIDNMISYYQGETSNIDQMNIWNKLKTTLLRLNTIILYSDDYKKFKRKMKKYSRLLEKITYIVNQNVYMISDIQPTVNSMLIELKDIRETSPKPESSIKRFKEFYKNIEFKYKLSIELPLTVLFATFIFFGVNELIGLILFLMSVISLYFRVRVKK